MCRVGLGVYIIHVGEVGSAMHALKHGAKGIGKDVKLAVQAHIGLEVLL